LRVHLARNGKFKKVDVSRVGQQLLYSTEDWIERRRLESVRYLTRFWLVLLVVFPIMFLVNFIASMNQPEFLRGTGRNWLISATTYYIVFASCHTVMEVWYQRREREHGVCTALYNRGLLFRTFGYPVRFFLPYEEIETCDDVPWFGVQTMAFKVRGRKWRVRFPYLPSILGPEGIALLKKRVAGVHEVVDAPKLVLYGTTRFQNAVQSVDERVPPPDGKS
jgi:hypothetical protein